MTYTSRIVSVVGATGNQGSGVVAVLLDSTDYVVRAVSSNPTSDKAKSLLSRHSKYVDEGRFTVVEGNLNDRASLEAAIKGSYGLFASFSPTPSEGPIEENPEVVQGKNLVDAAKAVGIQHFLYSSLPSAAKLSGGKLTDIFPFEAKAAVEKYARREFEQKSTFLIPGGFFNNLNMPVWARRREDGVFAITSPLGRDVKLGWLDEGYDMGRFAAAVFAKGTSVTAGKTYPVNSKPVTSQELADTYTKVTGEPSTVDPLELETVSRLLTPHVGETFSNALTSMFHLLNSAEPSPYTYGPGYIEKDTSFEDLGVKASTPEEFFTRTGWKAAPAARRPSA
ncbi:hypothetical protein JCM11491_002986 [Sporobolomyces phaffii]